MVKRYRKPHQYKKRKPIYRNRFFWLGILILISFSFLFYFSFVADFFQIKNISIVGLQQVSEARLISLVKGRTENKILFFPTRTIFLANFNEIEKDILRLFPQIAEVEIHRDFPDGLSISVVEREKTATFCKNDNCFALDKEGVIFEEAIDGDFRPIIKDFIFGGEMNLGEKVIEKDDLISILEINSQLEENLNIAVKEFIISAREKLIVRTEDGWELYFNLSSDVKWQLTKLKALLEEKIPPDKRGNLEYIELRFGNFANPKYKD